MLKYNSHKLCLLLHAFCQAPHNRGSSEQCYNKLFLHGLTMYLPFHWAVKSPLNISISECLQFSLKISYFLFCSLVLVYYFSNCRSWSLWGWRNKFGVLWLAFFLNMRANRAEYKLRVHHTGENKYYFKRHLLNRYIWICALES